MEEQLHSACPVLALIVEPCNKSGALQKLVLKMKTTTLLEPRADCGMMTALTYLVFDFAGICERPNSIHVIIKLPGRQSKVRL